MTEERLGLRREQEEMAPVPVVERLLAQPIAREEQLAPRGVPDGEGEHASQSLDTGLAPRDVRLQDHFGVAPRAEDAPLRLERRAELAKVVDLAVEDDPVAPGRIAHGLLARHQVDDRQPRHPEPDVVGRVDSRVVGSAVLEEPEHRGQQLARGRSDVAGDAAHLASLRPRPADAPRRSATVRRSSRARSDVRAAVNRPDRASARRRRSAATPASARTRTSVAAISGSRSGSNRRPASATTSGSAARLETATGAPQAIASSTVDPNPSSSDADTESAAPE